MTLLDAIILGLVEGITEYIPVSSTGHLILASTFLGLDSDPEMKRSVDAFVIIVQGGAILAVLGLFWPRVLQMFKGLVGRDASGLKMAVNLIVAFLPAAILGVLFNDLIERYLFFAWPVIAALFFGGVLMLGLKRWQDRVYRDVENGGDDHHDSNKTSHSPTQKYVSIENLSWQRALVIGLLQCVAMWPGTSRSMMTIVSGMFVGMKPRDAAEFSFLLGLPTLGGACVYKAMKNFMGDGPNVFEVLGTTEVVVGSIVALISALFAVKWLISYLTKHGLALFGWYRIALALILIALVSMNMITITPDNADVVPDAVPTIDANDSQISQRRSTEKSHHGEHCEHGGGASTNTATKLRFGSQHFQMTLS